jgi:hypothetical protein
MPKKPYMPKDDNGKADLLDLLGVKLPKYTAILEISAADLASVQADAACFRYTLNVQKQMQTNSQQWTAYKNLLRDGGTASANVPDAPVLPTPVPAAVDPGIVARLSAMVARIKNHKNCTPAIEQDLNITGADQTIDPTTWKPLLDILMQAGRPTVTWTKGGADSLEIWVDRGDGKGLVFLAIDTEPDYPDTAALPAPGTSAVWKYKAIYRLHDEQVGNWSDVISTTVGG